MIESFAGKYANPVPLAVFQIKITAHHPLGGACRYDKYYM